MRLDGTSAHLDALREGEMILATDLSGSLTPGRVSWLSMTKDAPQATFLALSTDGNVTLTLTPGHHLPTGPECCATLKKAKDVQLGEQVWALDGGSIASQRVVAKRLVLAPGLYSPVLTNGLLPVVDGLVTAPDNIFVVSLNAALGPYLLPLVKATRTSRSIARRALFGSGRKYIDGYETTTREGWLF